MTTARREFYDWPPEPHRRPPRDPDVRVTIHRHRRYTAQHWVMVAAIACLLVVLWRAKFMLLLLGVMVGPVVIAVLAVPVLLALVAWRERKAGRPF